MERYKLAFLVLLAAANIGVPAYAESTADSYPSRPIRMIVPISPGTTTDIVARTFAKRIGERLKQRVIVENKPGAGGSIAANYVAKAAPDGYTILLVNSQFTINPSVYRKLPFNTKTDFADIALVAEAPSALIVTPKLGVHSVKAFIAAAKKNPDTIKYASSGIGSQTHLAGAYFASKAGISLIHVPYSNASAVTTDLLTDRVQSVFVPPAFLLGELKNGSLLALGVTSREGMTEPIKAPSISEVAIPGYEYNTWFGFLAPAKTPAGILQKLAYEIQEITGESDVKKRLSALGIITRSLTLSKFQAYVNTDIEKEARIVKAAKISPR